MSNFARIIDGVAVDVSPNPTECFTPELAAQFVSVPSDVLPGWIQATDGSWSVAAPPAAVPVDLGPIRAALANAVNAHRDAVLSGGFSVPSETSSALGGKILQTRDADDKINWKLSRDAYKEASDAGHGQVLSAVFRTADNATITVSIAEGLTVLNAMQAWGVSVLGRSWTLKDAIAAATDQAAISAIDINTGWPA